MADDVLLGMDDLIRQLGIECSADLVVSVTYALGILLQRLESKEGPFCHKRHAMVSNLLHSTTCDVIAYLKQQASGRHHLPPANKAT